MTHSVSVIVPVHNGRSFLERALSSVANQSCGASEIIVVDDASSDASGEIAGHWARRRGEVELRQFRFPTNRGQAAALNHGVHHARGTLLAFLDADDEWLPHKLERQLGFLTSSEASDGVFGWAEQIDVRSGTPTSLGTLPARLPSALLLRSASWRRAGAFDETLRVGAVIEWCSRATAGGLRLPVLPEVLYRRYIHGSNLGLTATEPERAYLHVVRQHLRRKAEPAP